MGCGWPPSTTLLSRKHVAHLCVPLEELAECYVPHKARPKMGGGILMSDTLDLQLASLLLAFILIFTLIFEKFTFSLEHFFAEQEHFLECEPQRCASPRHTRTQACLCRAG